jgi:hypothetical protein
MLEIYNKEHFMKNYTKEIVLGSILILFFGGLIFWFARHESEAMLKIIIAALIIVIGSVSFILKLIKRRQDLQSGAPAEDEFTTMAKLHAGSQAFLYSMYLWLLIFVFNTTFSKNEEMLGIGILGSSLIYGICLWYFKSTGSFNEK